MIAPSLTGTIVELRSVTESDLNTLVNWYNEPNIFRFMSRDTPLTMDDQVAWYVSTQSSPNVLVWAVIDRDTKTLIGSATLRNLTDPAKRAEIGVLLGVSGSGFGSDVVRVILSYAFKVLDIQCVSSEVRGDNRRAISTNMRAGFKPEGILRRRLLKDGTLHDLYSMSILREEFEADDTQ